MIRLHIALNGNVLHRMAARPSALTSEATDLEPFFAFARVAKCEPNHGGVIVEVKTL
jgi:hypothetical protein